ncbi:MAG: hypothetical protein QM651_16080 [Rhodoblastus sp.]
MGAGQTEDALRSAAETFPPLRRFVGAEARLAAWARSGPPARRLPRRSKPPARGMKSG